MFSRSNLKELKTTILGIVILAASIVYVFLVDDVDVWVFGIMICVGISFMFLPDVLVESLRKLLQNNSEKRF